MGHGEFESNVILYTTGLLEHPSNLLRIKAKESTGI